ncbi:hypothetical protein BJ912DRAFT_1065670 [Pholiota molesta]|nr:hypothetical protein BJ912DRAFT_1065670 [Pholiota molesta]
MERATRRAIASSHPHSAPDTSSSPPSRQLRRPLAPPHLFLHPSPSDPPPLNDDVKRAMAARTSGCDLEQVGLAMSTDGRALTPSELCDTGDVRTVVHSAQRVSPNREWAKVLQYLMEKQRCTEMGGRW